MAMTLGPGVAGRLRAAAVTALRQGAGARVLGGQLDAREYQRLLTEGLGISRDDLVDEERLGAVVETALHRPVELADQLGVRPLFANRVGVQLARRIGVDPLRLALIAHDARPIAVGDGRIVETALAAATDRARSSGAVDQLSVTITLSPRAQWKGSRLTIRRTALPEAVVGTLPGRTLDQILDDDWEGWRSMRVRRARAQGSSVVIDTDAADTIDLIACSSQFEDGAETL